MPYDLKSLDQRHLKILEYTLRGATRQQIASAFNLSPEHVTNILSSTLFQHELAMRREKLNERVDEEIVKGDTAVADAIKSATLDAARRLGAIVAEGSGARTSDIIHASEAILDRGGFPRVQRTESKSATVVINAADAQLLADTLALLRDAR